MTTKVYLKDAAYIPIKYVQEEHMDLVKERLERHIYLKEITCERCEYFTERPSDVCDGCPNYKGQYKLHSITDTKIKGKMRQCLRLPYGDRAGIKKIFGDVEVIDKTPDRPMVKGFKMVQPLYAPQVPAVEKMLKVRSGVLKSPPRSGKTVMGAAYIAKKGQKTIILAAQQDWLDNFMETFIGSDTQPAMTTISKKRIGFAKKLEQFEKWDVCLCTYQTFLSKGGKKLLKQIRRMFGVVMVDEVQGAAALEYSRIISQFVARHKFGLSGTPERKDTLEYIIYKVFGSICYESKVERLRPRIEITTPPHMPKLPQTWTYAVGSLEKNPQRLKHIADTAVKDAKAGHTIFIPMARIPVIKALTKAINRISGKTLAVEFHGGVPKKLRKGLIDDLRQRKFRIAVGNSRMLSTGINIPCASMLYQVTPSSNLPKADQRFSRILTPHPNKLQPVVKYWLDSADIVRTCLRNEHFGCMIPTFRPMIDPITRGKLDEYFSNKKSKRNGGYEESFGGYI